MPDDFVLFCVLLVPSTVVGLTIGLALRRRRPLLCRRYAAWSSTLPWWFFAAGAGFFLLMGASSANGGYWSFAALFVGFALLDLVVMGLRLSRRAVSPPKPGGSA